MVMEFMQRTQSLLRETPGVRRAVPTLTSSWHRLDRSHRLYETRRVARHGRRPRFPLRVAMTPEMPRSIHGAYQLCVRLNVHLVPIAVAEVVLHFSDRTVRDELPQGLDIGAINGRLRDISKHHVNDVHGQVFGYDLTPGADDTDLMEKSDSNGGHDGRVVDRPSGAPGVVTQRLVDNRLTDHVVTDQRVSMMNGGIAWVILRYRPIQDRFLHHSRNVLAVVVDPSSQFSGAEQAQLVAMAQAMGADWAEFDVLRDRHSGRLYVVDVNGTPTAPSDGVTSPELETYWRLQERGFADLLRAHAG